MPQVRVEDTKGLYQQSGTGMVMIDDHVKPAIETLVHGSVALTFAAETQAGGDATSSDYGGKYFDISTYDAKYRVWFNHDSNSSAPSAAGGYNLVEVTLTSGTKAAELVAAAVEAALDGIDSGAEFYTNDGANDGTAMVYFQKPGAPIEAFSEGTAAALITSSTQVDGSGAGSNALSLKKRISVLNLGAVGTASNLYVAGTDAPVFTLADGAYVGHEKIILRSDLLDCDLKITINAYCAEDKGAPDSQDLVIEKSTNGSARLLDLIWNGTGWIARNAVLWSANATGLITGGDS